MYIKVTFLTIHFVTYISKILISQKVLTVDTYLLSCVVLPDLCNSYIHNNVMNENCFMLMHVMNEITVLRCYIHNNLLSYLFHIHNLSWKQSSMDFMD